MEQYLRPSEAAEILHVSPQTLRRWAAEGKLRHALTAGGHRRFPSAEVQRLSEALHREPQDRVAARELR
jgi:excisionase family DNA binding protein